MREQIIKEYEELKEKKAKFNKEREEFMAYKDREQDKLQKEADKLNKLKESVEKSMMDKQQMEE